MPTPYDLTFRPVEVRRLSFLWEISQYKGPTPSGKKKKNDEVGREELKEEEEWFIFFFFSLSLERARVCDDL